MLTIYVIPSLHKFDNFSTSPLMFFVAGCRALPPRRLHPRLVSRRALPRRQPLRPKSLLLPKRPLLPRNPLPRSLVWQPTQKPWARRVVQPRLKRQPPRLRPRPRLVLPHLSYLSQMVFVQHHLTWNSCVYTPSCYKVKTMALLHPRPTYFK